MRILRGIRLFTGGGSGGRRKALLATVALAMTVAGTGVLSASPASADTSNYGGLLALSSSYNLDVDNAATNANAWLDVWYQNHNANQNFTYPSSNGQVAPIEAQNSQMCVDTDGVAGDAVSQQPCDGSAGEQWEAETWTIWFLPGSLLVTFKNPASGLVLEIYGDSNSPGATIDAWYPDGGYNQSWIIPGCSNPTPVVCA